MENASNACLTQYPARRASSGPGYLQLVPAVPRVDPGRSDLRRALAEQGASCQQRCEPIRLWSALCAGTLRITELVESDARTSAVLERRSEGETAGAMVGRRRRDALQRRLAGQSEKAIAIDLGLASSTVCGDIRRSLDTLSVDPRTPGLMLFLARVYHATSRSQWGATFRRLAPGDLFVVTLPPLELNLARYLAPAELDVCQLLLRGCAHGEIARVRGTRPRTVSNQIATVFHKLNVSGRMALIAALVQQEHQESHHPCATEVEQLETLRVTSEASSSTLRIAHSASEAPAASSG
jgi:DNA-binding NarL/FixJ family response regulator